MYATRADARVPGHTLREAPIRGIRPLVGAVLVATLWGSAASMADSFRIDAGFIKDKAGRVLFLHGVNAVWKRPPYTPSSAYLDGRDADFLAANGLNSVRLGVLWVGVEPSRDAFDDAYLDRIMRIVNLLRSRRITVLLDFHQDMYNERYQGEGFP